MLKKILIGFLVFVVVLGVVIATRPSQFHVERSATIAVAPETGPRLIRTPRKLLKGRTQASVPRCRGLETMKLAKAK